MQFKTLSFFALSIGSVLGAPTTVARADPQVLTNAISQVSSTKATIDNQVAIIKDLATTVNSTTVSAIQASLNNIAAEINNLANFATPLVTDVALPLAQQELASLPGLVSDVKAIATDVEAALITLLDSLPQQALRLVKNQVLVVISTVPLLTQPVAQFAKAAVAGTSGPSTNAVNSLLSGLMSIVSQILGPIKMAFAKIW